MRIHRTLSFPRETHDQDIQVSAEVTVYAGTYHVSDVQSTAPISVQEKDVAVNELIDRARGLSRH